MVLFHEGQAILPAEVTSVWKCIPFTLSMETRVMGYRDDFYAKENIIGWTGDLNGDEFSVYFADCIGNPPKTVRIADVDQIVVQYGHITQKHDCPYNIGREEVSECFSYAIFNGGDDGHMTETVLGARGKERLQQGKTVKDRHHQVFHDSRSPFSPVTSGTIERLALLIDKFPDIKTRYTKENEFREWCRKNL